MANMTEKIENLDFSNQLKNMEKRLTELVDKKIETAIKTTCDKVDKTYAAVVSVESTQETDRIDYLDNRKQFFRVDNTRSETLDVTSGVPQGSLLGPLLFWIFINELPDVLVFSDPFIFADDLKTFAVKKMFWQVQNDLNGIEQWVNENKITSLWALN